MARVMFMDNNHVMCETTPEDEGESGQVMASVMLAMDHGVLQTSVAFCTIKGGPQVAAILRDTILKIMSPDLKICIRTWHEKAGEFRNTPLKWPEKAEWLVRPDQRAQQQEGVDPTQRNFRLNAPIT